MYDHSYLPLYRAIFAFYLQFLVTNCQSNFDNFGEFRPVDDFQDNSFQQQNWRSNQNQQDLNYNSGFGSGFDTDEYFCPPVFNSRTPDFSNINWNLVDRRCEEGWWHLFPFGERYFDINIAYRLWHDSQIDLDFFLPYYGFRFNYTFIFPEGFIAFSYPRYIQPPYTFPEPSWPDKEDPSLIAAFLAPQSFMFVGDIEISHVWYRIINRPITMINNRDEFAKVNDRTKPVSRMGNGQPYYRTYGRSLLKIQDGRVEDPVMLDIITRAFHEGMVGTRGFIADYALMVTWERMGYGGAPKSTRLDLYNEVKRWQNTYQMVVATDEIRTYVMFNYANVNWTSSTAAGALFGRGGKQSAVIGFNGGNGTGFYQMPYSAEGNTYKLVQFGATDVAGRWLVRADEMIEYGGCTNESLAAMAVNADSKIMLGGFAINISGPCFLPTHRLKLAYDEIFVDCWMLNMVKARCIIPPSSLFRFGPSEVKLSLDGGKQYNYKSIFYLLPPNLAEDDVLLIDDPIIGEDAWNGFEASNLTLRWAAVNISTDPSSSVDIEVWGYYEDLRVIRFEKVGYIARNLQNQGVYSFNPQLLNEADKDPIDAWEKFHFGFIQVITNSDWKIDNGDGAYLSRMVPFGWFWRPQYEEYYGDSWALKQCIEWFEHEGRLYQFWGEVEQASSCPCTLEQAELSMGEFMPMPDCDMNGNGDCSYAASASHCIVSVYALYAGSAQMCCYDPDGWLMFSQDYEYDSDYVSVYGAGVPQRSHPFGAYPFRRPPFIPGLSNYYYDRYPLTLCCLWTNHCEFYYWRRESSGCQKYVPSVTGFAYGDAHFITFDGLKYSFNGKGYFVLSYLQSPDKNLMVQIRLEQPPKTIWDAHVGASVITGVAAQDNNSDVVEIFARREFRRWRYKMDVYVWGRRIFTDRPFKKLQVGPSVTIWTPSTNLNTSIVWVFFSTGVGLRVAEDNGVLNVGIVLPDHYNSTFKYQRQAPGGGKLSQLYNTMNVMDHIGDACTETYTTLGLLGTWNGIADDDLMTDTCDFITPLGPRPSPADSMRLYSQFGMKYKVDGVNFDLLFDPRHQPIYDPIRFNQENWMPEFDPMHKPLGNASLILSKEQVRAACGGSSACEYDFLMTGRREIAMDTLKNERLFEAMKASDSQRLISCGPLQKNRGVVKFPPGNTYLEGVVVTFACQPEYYRHGEEQRYCENGTWSPGWWVWCRSRAIEEGLKWFTGIIVSLLIIAFIAAILLWCYFTNVRGRKSVAKHYSAGVHNHPPDGHTHARSPEVAKVTRSIPPAYSAEDKKVFTIPLMEGEPVRTGSLSREPHGVAI